MADDGVAARKDFSPMLSRSLSFLPSGCSWFALLILAFAGAGGPCAKGAEAVVECEGAYPRHLQGVATDGGGAIFWSWTDALVKTDAGGKVLAKVAVASHHGDLCVQSGRVYVAVNLGKFNEAPGKADSWVYVYDAGTLEFVAKHAVPEVVHGAGGMAYGDRKFIVVGGLPPEVGENYLYEYDGEFRFVERHVVASGPTDKGIQTITFGNGAWWCGCYGRTLLRADKEFAFTGRWAFDAAVGLQALPDGRFLIGKNVAEKGVGNRGSVRIAREDAGKGLMIELSAASLPGAGR